MFYLSLFLLSLLAIPPQEIKTVTAQEAKAHAGEVVRVCGVVRSLYASRRRQQPSFLNFDQPYPRNPFAAVIWQRERPQFGDLRKLKGQRVCVNGQVYLYRERAQMKLAKPEQLLTNN